MQGVRPSREDAATVVADKDDVTLDTRDKVDGTLDTTGWEGGRDGPLHRFEREGDGT